MISLFDYGTDFTDKAHEELVKRFETLYSDAQKEIKQKVIDHTKRTNAQDKVMRARLASGKITSAQYNDWRSRTLFRGNLWRSRLSSITSTLYDVNRQANAIIEGKKRAVFGENATYQAYQLEHDAKLDLSFTIYDSATVTRILRENPTLLKPREMSKEKDTEWNQRNVTTAVAQGIIQGDSIDEIAQRIAKNTASKNEAAMIRYTRTAMTSAQNAGRIEVLHEAVEMGIKVKKVWLATLDERTRESHALLDGQVQEVDHPFSSMLGLIDFPGDPNAADANIWNCRCTLTYEYEEYPKENSVRRDNIDGEIIEDMTYEEWKEKKAPKTQTKDRKTSTTRKTSGTSKTQQTTQKQENVVESKAQKEKPKEIFTPAKTIEEAEAFAKTFCDDRKFGAVGVSYDGLTLDSANAVNKTISDFYNEYKIDKFGGVVAPAGNTKLGKLVSEAVAGYSPVRHSIILNRKSLKSVDTAAKDFKKQQDMVTSYLKNPSGWKIKSEVAKKVLEASAVSGRATVPMTVEEAIWHELGHSLERELRNLSSYSSIKEKHAEWGEKISGYATTNFDEYIAESFCAMKKGETIESGLADAFKSLRR